MKYKKLIGEIYILTMIAIIKIKNILDAERVLEILEDKKIPVVGMCECVFDIYKEKVQHKLTSNYTKHRCKDYHIILVPDRYHEFVLEILQFVEEGFPILY